jgi:Xaa-Pro aminopeptidase
MDRVEPAPRERFVDPDRVEKIRTRLRTSDIDGLLGLSPANSYYLSGAYFGFYQRPLAGVVTAETAGLVCSTIREATVRRTSWCDWGVLYGDTDDPFDALLEGIRRADVDTLGVDMSDSKWGTVSTLEREADVTLLDRSELFASLRARKTDWELDKIRRAGDLADAGIEAFVERAETGMTEVELASEMETAYLDAYRERHPEFDLGNASDGSQYSFTNVLAGGNAFSAGKLSTSREIGDGDCVMSIAIPALQGYHCENERALVVGDPSDAVISAMETHVDLRRAVIDYIGPDRAVAEVDSYAYDLFGERGYELEHRTGHGLGISFHEEPSLNRRKSGHLDPGMVVTVEPGVYLPEEDAVIRHSDTVVVTDDGAERLTSTDDGVLMAG